MQAVPQPYEQVAFERDGVEIARYHFGPTLRRPFVFPVVGPAGRSLTRMGHPHDPESHSHHNSVWVSHNDVNGVSFWDDRAKGRIIHQRVDGFADEGDVSSVTTTNGWVATADGKPLLTERRRTTVQLLDAGEWLLVIDLRLEPAGKVPVTLGKTPFGLVGVRMAKTIGTADGGGTIRNAAGGVNEAEVFWKPAKWCDYSGPITPTAAEGITLMDHPANPNHPTVFHVRGDGWMGASLTHAGPRVIPPGEPLRLRYGLYVHAGIPPAEAAGEAVGGVRQDRVAGPCTEAGKVAKRRAIPDAVIRGAARPERATPFTRAAPAVADGPAVRSAGRGRRPWRRGAPTSRPTAPGRGRRRTAARRRRGPTRGGRTGRRSTPPAGRGRV